MRVLRRHFAGASVSFVYRHWPLSYHRLAYPAARAAECAADQGKFSMYHELLYNEAGWMFDPRTGFVDLAERAEVPDLEDFNRCIDSSEPVAAISTDIAAAEKLGGGGTPTLLINGLLVGTYRDTTELFAIVDNALKP